MFVFQVRHNAFIREMRIDHHDDDDESKTYIPIRTYVYTYTHIRVYLYAHTLIFIRVLSAFFG